MFEFILFLSAHEEKIIELVQKAEYTLEENTPLCLLDDKFFGFLKKTQKRIVICTENAKKYGGHKFTNNRNSNESSITGRMVRRAVRHEAIHVAQECNNGRALDFAKTKNIKISPYKLNALKSSIELVGQKEKEYEAYALEDRPRYVISLLRKYCFKDINNPIL